MTTITCTVGPDSFGHRCGKPAVSSFVGSNGTTYAECAEHDTSAIVAEARHIGYEVGDTAVVRRYGKDYIGRVVRVTRAGGVYVRFAYGNGASRIVKV